MASSAVPKTCLSTFPCLNPPHAGFTHCWKHILGDQQQTEYVQCEYTFDNGRRCFRHCPSSRFERLCDAHLAVFSRLRDRVEREAASSDVKYASKHKRLILSYARLKRSLASDNGAIAVASSSDALPAPSGKKARLQMILGGARLEDKTDSELEAYCSADCDEDSDSKDSSIFGRNNKEAMNICTTTRDDAEEECPLFNSIDAPLEKAGTLTEEEILTVAQAKFLRLRELYQKEQQLIRRILIEKRRKYLQSLRREQEQFGTVPFEPERMSPEEKIMFEKLVALKRYSKIRGPEALLHQRSIDLASSSFQPKSSSKCVFSHQRGVKCGEKTVPLSKYCFKHVLSDPCQVLFRSCGFDIPDGEKCHDPVFPITEDARCLLHSSGPENSVMKS